MKIMLGKNPDTIGQWCCLKYDNEIYPGVIQDVNKTQVRVKCSNRIGINHWPLRDDVLWYLHEEIFKIIPPPV